MSAAAMASAPASAVLDATSPEAPLDWAHALLAQHWDLRGDLRPLAGERDRNFLLTLADTTPQRRCMLKISHPGEAPLVADFQTQALLHIARSDPSLPVQRMVPTRDGRASLLAEAPDGSTRVVRLFSYLAGEPLSGARRSPAQAEALACLLARLDLALRDFRHPAGALELPWDIQRADGVARLLDSIDDPVRHALARRALDRFATHVKPRLGELRRQPIHNDFNIFNLLVDPQDHDRIAGILDFGDMVHAPLIDDLAVAAAYQVDAGGDTLAALCRFTAAYHAVLPLLPLELDLLFDLVQARLLMVVAISGWRAAREPDNADYLLRNNAVSWARLAACDAIDRGQAGAALRSACVIA
ncbi:phosphotransferase [Cupriavidus campinensis]